MVREQESRTDLPLSSPASWPVARVTRLTDPLARFLKVESAGGAVLFTCTIISLVLANSSAAGWWAAFWHTRIGIEIGSFSLGGELGHFLVNDILMTTFFFVVGLEIKRELVAGELREPRKAALPILAALGGMVVPAGIYFALTHGTPGERGWGIPMATDIAFVVGVMALFGSRFPVGLKVMLLTLAIADDIGAVVVIAAFYNTGLNWGSLALAGGGLALVYLIRLLGVRSVGIYTLIGVFVWLGFYKSGVHPTVAGVILGLMTPASVWISPLLVRRTLADATRELKAERNEEIGAHDLDAVSFATREAVSPLVRLETTLHPWVNFIVMPVFALANAGVAIEPAAVTDPIAVAVALGLFLGKPIGVVAASWLAVRSRIAELPSGATWSLMLGAGMLAGIGFTMSLFVAGLALEDAHLTAGKVGTLTGSACSAVVGSGILLLALRRGKPTV